MKWSMVNWTATALLLVVSGVVNNVSAQSWTEPFVPDANTVALWHLDGNGDDASGNGNNLVIKTDRVSWVSGIFNQCAEMGTDPWSGGCGASDGGALTAPGPGCTYPGSGDWTVEAWVQVPSNSGGYYAVMHYSQHWTSRQPRSFQSTYPGTMSLWEVATVAPAQA